jgi:hypothetical protein
MINTDAREYLREERCDSRLAAKAFVHVIKTDRVDLLPNAVDFLNETVGSWTIAIRKIAREVTEASPAMQSAFLSIWIKSNVLPLRVGDHRALCTAARVLLPRYRGPAVHLFRGAGAHEHRRRIYGLSWTTDIKVADMFAQLQRIGLQSDTADSVLLETLAPGRAILCAVTNAAEGHSGEDEYVVDRRLLNKVKVMRRYPRLNKVKQGEQI